MEKRKFWIGGVALLLAVVMIANTVLSAVFQITLSGSDEETAKGYATNYLLDSNGYLTKDTLARMGEVLGTYYTPSGWEDYLSKAEIDISKEDYEKALSDVNEAISKYDGDDDEKLSSIYLERGCLEILMGQEEEALADFNKSVDLNAEQDQVYLLMAQIYSGREDVDNTTHCLEEYLSRSEGNAESKITLAELYLANGDYEKSFKWFQEGLDESADAEVYFEAALCAIQLEDGKTSEAYLTKAIEMDDTVGDVYYYRGIARLMEEDYGPALSDFKIAVERTEDTSLKVEINDLIDQLEASGVTPET